MFYFWFIHLTNNHHKGTYSIEVKKKKVFKQLFQQKYVLKRKRVGKIRTQFIILRMNELIRGKYGRKSFDSMCAFFMKKGNASLIISEKKNSMQV